MIVAEASLKENWDPAQQGALVRGTFQETYYAKVLSLADYDVEAVACKPADISSRMSQLLHMYFTIASPCMEDG